MNSIGCFKIVCILSVYITRLVFGPKTIRVLTSEKRENTRARTPQLLSKFEPGTVLRRARARIALKLQRANYGTNPMMMNQPAPLSSNGITWCNNM